MNKIDTITQIEAKVLDKYRNSIPRKAFIEAIELIKDSAIESAKVPEGEPVPGLQIIKSPYATAGELSELLSGSCPPFAEGCGDVSCRDTSCRDCWLAWLTTGRPKNEGKEENR